MSYAVRQNPFPEALHFDNAGFHRGRRMIMVTRPFLVVTSLGRFEVPVGFECDGASIPRLAQAIIGHPFDEYLEDAVAHDYLYHPTSDWLEFDRGEADTILRETMWNRRFPLWKLSSFYMAVRVGGGFHYKRQP